jgi:hypothetical protein
VIVDRKSDLRNWVDVLKQMMNTKKILKLFARKQPLRRTRASNGETIHGFVGQETVEL